MRSFFCRAVIFLHVTYVVDALRRLLRLTGSVYMIITRKCAPIAYNEEGINHVFLMSFKSCMLIISNDILLLYLIFLFKSLHNTDKHQLWIHSFEFFEFL